MLEKRIEIQPGQSLVLSELAADASVSGGDETQVSIRLERGTEEDILVEAGPDGPSLSVQRACEVRLPASIPVAVRQAEGSLKVKGVSSLSAAQVRGNLRLDDVESAEVAEVFGSLKAEDVAALRVLGTVYGSASLDEVERADLQDVRGSLRAKHLLRLRAARISGSLEAKEVAETIEVDQVGGDAALKEVGGLVTVDQVAGNLIAKELGGGARVSRIGGNLFLVGGLGDDGHAFRFHCDGNALLRLEEGVNARVTLTARGQLHSSLHLTGEERNGQTFTGTIGSGATELTVEAKGNLMLGGKHAEAGAELGERIARQMEESLRAIDLEGVVRQAGQEAMDAAMSRLRVKVETMDWERLGQRAQESVQRAMDRLQRDMVHLQARAERRQEWLERRAEREAHRLERWERRAQAAAKAAGTTAASMDEEADRPDGPAPAEEPQASLDEERLTILKMLEQGQVTPEEAGMLLDALE